MPNRYANLTPSAKISQEYTKITEGFDKVQVEMDQRVAKDNDLQQQVTDHRNSTTAHKAEHITYSGKVSGASNIKQAADRLNDRIDNIVAQGGSDNTEVVDARMGADGVARPTLGTLVREIHAQQIDSARQTVTLKHGQNIVTTDQASPAEIIVKGRTMVNLLGVDGNFEKDSNGDGVADGWTVLNSFGSMAHSATNVRYGNYSQRINAIATDTSQLRGVFKQINLIGGRYYLVLADVITDGNTPAFIRLLSGDTIDVSSSASNASKTHFLKVAPSSNIQVRFILYNNAAVGVTGSIWFDGASVYEIDAATYAAIGTTITEANIREYFPYVDRVQHVVNPVITKYGKNLIPPFYKWSVLHSNAKILGPYKLELVATAVDQQSSVRVPLMPNQTYTVSVPSASSDSQLEIAQYNSAGAFLKSEYTGYGRTTYTFSSHPNVSYAVVITRNRATGVFTFENLQLELGGNATPFEPRNDDHVYAECTLRSLPNGVRDVLDVGEKSKLTGVGQVILDGSENWASFAAGEGHSSMAIHGWQNANNAVRFYVVNPNAALATNDEFASIPISTSGDIFPSIGVVSNGALVLYLPTAYSSASEFKAYLAEHPITLIYQLASPITETVPVEGALSLHDGGNIIEVGEGAIREKVNFDISTKRADLSQRSARVLAVHKNADPVAFTTYTSNNSVQPQLIENVDPDSEYTVWYQALDRYDMTTNVVDVAVTYKTNQKTVVDGLVQDMADAKTEISIHDRILAELVSRLVALEEGV